MAVEMRASFILKVSDTHNLKGKDQKKMNLNHFIFSMAAYVGVADTGGRYDQSRLPQKSIMSDKKTREGKHHSRHDQAPGTEAYFILDCLIESA